MNLFGFAMTQVWQVPFLLMFLIGLFIALSRRDLGRAQSYAVIGFAVLALSVLVQSAQMYQLFMMREGGDYRSIATRSAVFTLVAAVVKIGGFILLMVALFIDRGQKTDTSPSTGTT